MVSLHANTTEKTCKRGHNDWYPNGRCRQCAIQRAAGWAAKNPEKRKEIANSYYDRNKDHYAEGRSERWASWYYGGHEKNKESRRVRQAARRSMFSGRFTVEEVASIRDMQGDKCAACATKLCGGGEIDHIQPISKGGLNVAANIQILCQFCNRSKKDKDPIDFMRQQGKLL